MGLESAPDRAKLIVGLIAGKERYFMDCRALLVKKFGIIDFESDQIDFTATKYYNEEFGGGLKRRFLSFKNLISLNGIARVKLVTNAIEKRFSISGKRYINIDPGYLLFSKLVLLTTKDYTHRIYLSKGIYSEVTLYYKDGTFNPMDWTYPDYKSEKYINIFNHIRSIYKKDLRALI